MLALNAPLSVNANVPFVISYVPTFDVAVALVVGAPVTFPVSPLTPVFPTVAVNVGFAAPYALLLLSAVTVISFAVIVADFSKLVALNS